MSVFSFSNGHSNLINMLCNLLTYFDSDFVWLSFIARKMKSILIRLLSTFCTWKDKCDYNLNQVMATCKLYTYDTHVCLFSFWNIHSNNANIKSNMLCNLLAKYVAVKLKRLKSETSHFSKHIHGVYLAPNQFKVWSLDYSILMLNSQAAQEVL